MNKMSKEQLELLQKADFPLVEALYAKSRSVNWDTAEAHAIISVRTADAATRLRYLAQLLPLGDLKPEVVKGYELSHTWSRYETGRNTVADDMIYDFDEFEGKSFEVIWLDEKDVQHSDYNRESHSGAGRSAIKKLGIVIRYPEELIL